MVFVERFLHKRPEEVSESDIVSFLSRGIEEGLNLDYKQIDFYDDFDELSKHVSAFANSEGGLMLLGVSEEKIKHKGTYTKIFPKAITWGDVSRTREKLEDNVLSRIHHSIDGLRIVPVRNKKSEVIFLIDVPQSDNPPHMAFDHRYWKRHNFRVVVMEHYEVRDLFGKRRKPHIAVDIEFLKITETNSLYTIKIRLWGVNLGKALAHYVRIGCMFEGFDILSSEKTLVRADELRRTPALQYDAGNTVYYPPPSRTAFGSVTLRTQPKASRFMIRTEQMAEDMEFLTSEAELNTQDFDKAKQDIEVGQRYLLQLSYPKEFEDKSEFLRPQ